jgi:hypothetical protein
MSITLGGRGGGAPTGVRSLPKGEDTRRKPYSLFRIRIAGRSC